jgi:cullin-4
MVQRLLNFKALADLTLSTSFADAGNTASSNSGMVSSEKSNTSAAQHHQSQFNYALIDAFQTGFKTRRNKPAEMIAKYMDKTMREPTREISDAEFEKQLDAALALYRFTDDKDIFRTFYHRALARRLLLGKSSSDDDEKLVLKKLKERMYFYIVNMAMCSDGISVPQITILNSGWETTCSTILPFLGN